MKTQKLSFDPTDKNRCILNELKYYADARYKQILNTLITANLDIDSDMIDLYIQFWTDCHDRLLNKRKYASPFEEAELDEKILACTNMISLVSHRPMLSPDYIYRHLMSEVTLKDGILTCPSNWHILNPSDAKASTYASVVECKNASEYDLPYFVYLSTIPCVDFTDETVTIVYDLCQQAFPAFADVLAHQVDPKLDPEHPGKVINADEYLSAPQVNIFNIFRENDPALPKGYKHPFDAKIISR